MARSYNVSFNINGALDGSLLAALQNAANAMRGLGNAARAASANARASQAGLQGLATSLTSLQQAAQRYQALQAALRQTTADFGRSGAALEAAKAKFNADTQAAEELRRKLSDLRKELNQAKTAKIGESTGLKSLRQQMRELRRAYAEAKRAGDTLKTTQLKSQMTALGAAIQAQQAKVRQAAAAYKELSDKARQMKTELKAAEQAAAASGQGLSRARQDADRLRQSYQQQLAALNQLKASLTAAGFDTSNFAASESRLAADINRVNAALARQTELINAQRASQQASQNMFNAYNNFQSALQTAETIAAPFKSATENAMNFEYEMSKVKALSQMRNLRAGNLEQAEASMERLTKLAEQLGATTEFTSTEVAQSMGKYAMAGWTDKQIEAAMQSTVDAASIAGDHNIMRTADVLSDDAMAFGIKAGEAYKLAGGKVVDGVKYFTDAFAYAWTNANLDRESLHEAWKYNAPTAKASGLSLGETLAQNMFIANAGIKGSMAGTSFRAGWTRFLAPPKTAIKSLEEAGLTASDATKQIMESQAALREAGVAENASLFDKIVGAYKYYQTLDENQRAGWLKGLVGQNALSGWQIAFDKGGIEQISEIAKEIDNGEVEGWAADTAKVMRDNTKTAVELLKSSFDALQRSIGKALTPALRAAAEAFAPMVTAAGEWIADHPAVVQSIAAIAGALAGLIVAAAAVKLAFAGFTFITTSIQLVSTALASLGSGALLGGLIGRIAALRTALFGLGGAATIGGWGAMFAAISARATAAAVAVRTFFASLTLGSVASGVTGVLSSIGTAIMGVARAALGLAFSPVGAALLALGAAAYFCYQNWDRVSAVLSTIGNLLTNSLGRAMAALEPAFVNLSNALDNLFGNGVLQSALSGLGQLVTSVLATIVTTIAGALGTVINVAAQILAAVTNIITGIINLVTSAINGEWSAALANAKSIATSAFEGIGNVANAILGGILSTVRAIGDAWDFLRGRRLPGTHGDEAHGGGSGDFGEPEQTAPAQAPAPVQTATPEAPALDTSATQSALDAVGSSAQNAATNMDAVNTATQNISQVGEALGQLPASFQPVQDAMPQVATSATNASTALTQTGTSAQNVSTALTADATGLSSHTSALQANASALQANIGALNAFGAACNGAVGGVNALGSAASSAAGSVSGLGSAAQSACAELAAAGANAAARVNAAAASAGAPKAANYMGGIYRKGAFVTTFAERSAEAAIPLDGSRRAQDLWTQAGQILGLLPSTQPVTYETPRNRDETKYRRREVPTRRARRPVERARRETFAKPYETPRNLPQLPKIFTQTQPTTYDTTEIIKQTQETLIRELPGKLISARASGKADGGLLGKLLGAFKPQATNVSFLPKIFTQTQPTTYNSQNQSEINNSMSHTLTMPQTFRQAQSSTYNALTQSATENSETRTLDMPRTFSQIQSQIYNSRSESLSRALTMSQMLAEPQASAYQPLAGDAPNQLISAQDTAGLVNKSATTSATTLNVTINVNISGNADEQTVRRGVESALPQLDDWFARYNEHMHEERRRSYA